MSNIAKIRGARRAGAAPPPVVPTLGPLSLSQTNFTVGVPASGTINGFTTASTIAALGLPTGFVINGITRTWTYDGTGSPGVVGATFTETLAGATNSPRQTVINITYAAPASIQTAEPAASWAAATTGEAAIGTGGALPTLSLASRTVSGLGFPGEPSWRANIADWFADPDLENDTGYTVFVYHEIGNEDGWDDTIFTIEGADYPVTPGLYSIDGRVAFGSAIKIRGLPSKWGWANLTWRIRPKRGFEAMHTVRVWLNRNNAANRGSGTGTVWVNPNAVSEGTGTQVSPYKTIGRAMGHGSGDVTLMERGWTIYLMAGTHTSVSGISSLKNEGPIFVMPAPGVAKTDLVITNGGAASPTIMEFNNQRVSLFDCQVALWGIRQFSAPRTNPAVNGTLKGGGLGGGLGGIFYFRDGCDLRDAVGLSDFASARAGGTIEFGVLTGQVARDHRFWSADFTARVAHIGKPSNPIIVKLTHAFPGSRAVYAAQGEYSWSGFFPISDDRDSNTGGLFVELTGHGNFWGRKHGDVWLEVTGKTSETLSGTWGSLTMYKVAVSNGGGLPNLPPVNGRTFLASGTLSQSAVQLAASEHTQVWARCRNGANPCIANPLPGWGSGRTPNEAGIYGDGIGPPHPQNRDGSRDFPDLGFSVLGYEPGFVYLLNDPGTITHMNVCTGHGNHSLFIQASNERSTRGSLCNYVLAHSSVEHPENYLQFQQNCDVATGTGTISIAADGLCTLSSGQSVFKGWSIRLTSAGSGTDNNGKIFVVRHVVSATQFYVNTIDISPTTGAPVAILSGTVTGASFQLLRGGVYTLDLSRDFIWGNASSNFGGTINNLIIKDSTIHNLNKFGLGLTAFLNPANFEHWQAGRIVDSYITGFTISSGPTPAPWSTNNHFAQAINLDTGTQTTASLGTSPGFGFGVSRKPAGLALLRSRTSVSRLGEVVTAGVNVVGSEK